MIFILRIIVIIDCWKKKNLITFEGYDTRRGKENESDFSWNNLENHKSENWQIITTNIPFLLLLTGGYMTNKSFYTPQCKHMKKNEMTEAIMKDFICLFIH